jgi:predicted phosphohydrolase
MRRPAYRQGEGTVGRGMMKIAAISDTHEKHNYINDFPQADVFLFAGDATMIGEFDWVSNFNKWLGNLPYKYKIVIGGNHDRSLDLQSDGFDIEAARDYGKEMFDNAIYLLDEGCLVEGKHFWGSPYTPFFASEYWKFHYDVGDGQKQWAKIPQDLDVLITHGPPLGILDKTLEGNNAGCYDLKNRLEELTFNESAPKHHIFGHIHEAKGEAYNGYTLFHNVSAVDRRYNI